MSRVLPLPPEGLALSPIPALKLDAAVEWVKSVGPEITPRYLHEQANRGQVRTRVIGGTRYFATADLYEWLLTRGRTAKASR